MRNLLLLELFKIGMRRLMRIVLGHWRLILQKKRFWKMTKEITHLGSFWVTNMKNCLCLRGISPSWQTGMLLNPTQLIYLTAKMSITCPIWQIRQLKQMKSTRRIVLSRNYHFLILRKPATVWITFRGASRGGMRWIQWNFATNKLR